MRADKPWLPDFLVEPQRKKAHGLRLRNARQHYGTHRICPDCFQPRHLCEHTEEWVFLRHST